MVETTNIPTAGVGGGKQSLYPKMVIGNPFANFITVLIVPSRLPSPPNLLLQQNKLRKYIRRLGPVLYLYLLTLESLLIISTSELLPRI
jgi:hypothetical protein